MLGYLLLGLSSCEIKGPFCETILMTRDFFSRLLQKYLVLQKFTHKNVYDRRCARKRTFPRKCKFLLYFLECLHSPYNLSPIVRPATLSKKTYLINSQNYSKKYTMRTGKIAMSLDINSRLVG